MNLNILYPPCILLNYLAKFRSKCILLGLINSSQMKFQSFRVSDTFVTQKYFIQSSYCFFFNFPNKTGCVYRLQRISMGMFRADVKQIGVSK